MFLMVFLLWLSFLGLSGFHARTLAALCSFTVLVIVFVALFWTLRVALFGQLFLLMMLRFMSFACTLLTGTRLETTFFILLWITSTLVPLLLSVGILTLSLTGPEISVVSLLPLCLGIFPGFLLPFLGTILSWTFGAIFILTLRRSPG